MKFAVEFEPGKFMLQTPDWSSCYDDNRRKDKSWTDDFIKGCKWDTQVYVGRYTDIEFFQEYYPQFNIIYGED